MKGRFADPKHLSTVSLSSQHRKSVKGVIGWTFFISPGVSRLIGSRFLAFLSPGTKREFPLILIVWFYRHGHIRACGCGQPWRWSLLSSTCCLGLVCMEGEGQPERRGALPVGCSLQLKAQGGLQGCSCESFDVKACRK